MFKQFKWPRPQCVNNTLCGTSYQLYTYTKHWLEPSVPSVKHRNNMRYAVWLHSANTAATVIWRELPANSNRTNKEVKLTLSMPWRRAGGDQAQLHSFNSALDRGVQWSTTLQSFYPHYPLNKTKGGHYGWSECFAVEKIPLATARNWNADHPACSLVTIVAKLSQHLTILISKSKIIYSLTHTL